MKRCVLSLSISAALTGCAGAPQKVSVPMPIPCTVEIPPQPVWATSTLGPKATRFEMVRALLAEREQARGYIVQLEAVARACQ